MINVVKLNKWYENKQVLYNVSFSIKKGECFCLLGPNGAGKTTTMKIMTGMLRADQGSVEICSNKSSQTHKYRKISIAIIPQYANLDPLLTVEENIIFFGLLQKLNYRELQQRTAHLLDAFEISHLKKQITYRCSGGEHQRLLVARAFLRPSDIIFMDEPTAGIDILFKNRLWDFFKNEKKKGTTIYLNTHDLNEAEILSDRIGFLFNGRIIAIDTPDKLKSLEREASIIIKCRDRIECFELSEKYDYMVNDKNLTLRVQTINSDIIKVLEILSVNNHIIDIEITRPSLNDVFRQLGVEHAGNTMA